jgi:glycosyltransferase involved in cell wall biosynthesis
VDPRDAAALASALSRVLGEPQLAKRISVAGRERVKEFTWAKVVDEYEAIYERVVPHRRPTRAS